MGVNCDCQKINERHYSFWPIYSIITGFWESILIDKHKNTKKILDIIILHHY